MLFLQLRLLKISSRSIFHFLLALLFQRIFFPVFLWSLHCSSSLALTTAWARSRLACLNSASWSISSKVFCVLAKSAAARSFAKSSALSRLDKPYYGSVIVFKYNNKEWIIDVAHNREAATNLADCVNTLPKYETTLGIFGLQKRGMSLWSKWN